MSWRNAARYYPSVTGSFSATRQRQSGQIAPVLNSNAFLYNLFTPQVSVSYVPDVFGLNRRTVESLQAQEQGVRFQMVAAYTTLTANVVVTAIQVASLQMQIDATRQLIDINTEYRRISCATSSTRVTPAGSISPRRNRSSRRSPPPCRRSSSNWPSRATCWRCWPAAFRTRRRSRNSSCRVCNCRRNCR